MVERLDDGVERPGADDLVRLGPQREREHLLRRAPDRSSHCPTICGDIDEVAQVSITSVSGVKLVAAARAGRRRLRLRRVNRQVVVIAPGCVAPQASQYQTGKGTPK